MPGLTTYRLELVFQFHDRSHLGVSNGKSHTIFAFVVDMIFPLQLG